ncbi:50S ribosomal protein P1 [Candidatus Nitrososphaera sp. FF02]|uniref:50S ribosomal protein P1 n=1 Tax=Candidatus Nitrososphaera sp. FF02 TaxID=3398226 RepID=UPI0039ED8DFF
MEYVYAALLLHKLKQNITEDNVKSVVKAAGVSPDDVRVKALVAALSEVNIEEALKAAPVAMAAAARQAALLRQQAERLRQRKKRRTRRKRKKPSRACPRSLVKPSPFSPFYVS